MSTRKRHMFSEYNCFFITTTFKDWIPLLINDNYYNIICESLDFCLDKYNADLIAYVLMPDHIHLIVYFNKETNVSGFMRDFKKYSSVRIRKNLEEEKKVNIIEQLVFNKYGQKFKVWQNRFDAVLIKSKEVLLTKMEYIHHNPVRKGLVTQPVDWIYSSAGYYLNSTKETSINATKEILTLRHAGEIV